MSDGPDASPSAADPRLVVESPEARSRIVELRARFVVSRPSARQGGGPKAVAPVIGPSEAQFQRTGDGHLRPHFGGTRSAIAPAIVSLAARADGDMTVEDERSRMALKTRLRGASDVGPELASGTAVYAGALRGSDVVHRPRPDGTEDFVVFETRPDREELVYDVDVSRAAGLRLVGNTLELLDATGTPRLRMAPPYVVDARGALAEAAVSVSGCAYDTNPAGPWGRPVTLPGASSCQVRVAWTASAYPAIVDPAWTTTGTMIRPRVLHDATLLNTGKVLITGGCQYATAELFYGGTFTATGLMTRARDSGATATLLSSGKVLIAGGWDPNATAATAVQATAEIYDPTAGTFTVTGSMNHPRDAHTATLLKSGKVLIAGGGGAGLITVDDATAELFDGTSSFAFTGSMSLAREKHVATLLQSGKVLIAGGSSTAISTNAGRTATAELFDGTSAFTTVGSMASPREAHTATLLSSGKVLIAGGYNGATVVAQAELFDGTSAFTTTGSMTATREGHSATLLPSGQVLIAGGAPAISYPYTYLTSTELFDGTSSFSPSNAMNREHAFHAAVFIPPATVLVAGGNESINSAITTLAVAELYTLVAAGGACSSAKDCLSGVCDDGVCCAGACNGTCQTCTAGTGACVAVKGAADPDTCAGTQSCDAAGVCKLANGQATASASACASGILADGVCCDAACDGACDACAKAAGAAVDGSCSLVAQGAAGNPACGAGYACSGASNVCRVPCTGDADCATGYFCAANGTCTAQLAQGTACNLATDCKGPNCRECASGNCIDGVCCDTACAGVCFACAAVLKQSGADGVCGPVAFEKTPPRGSCPTATPGSCGPDGTCNGAGACMGFAPAGAACGPAVCNGSSVSGDVCNGAGGCASGSSVDCSPYACESGACATTCTTDADCAADALCSKGGACVLKGSLASSCRSGNDCASGFCVDGYCCNSDCTGQCEACSIAGLEGTCSAVTGTPRGARAACGSDGTACGGACDGQKRATCTYHDGESCGATCANGQEIALTCTSLGTCAASSQKACPGSIVACDGPTCKTACASDGDCAQGYACAVGACLPVTAACDGAHTVKVPNGTDTDCSPYGCEGDHCRTVCNSIHDCVEGNVCDASGHCVPISSGAAIGNPSGCTVRGPGGSGVRGGGLALAAVAMTGLLRRRRRGGARVG